MHSVVRRQAGLCRMLSRSWVGIRMVFSLQNLKKLHNVIIRLLAPLLLCLMAAMPAVRANDAESIRLVRPTLTQISESAWMLDADVDVALSPVLVEAVKRGVPLYFISEIELSRNRWYWFDQAIFSQSKTVRLSYHAVLQQFRVGVGNLHQQTYPTLDEALKAATNLHGWSLSDNASQALTGVAKEVQRNPDRYEFRLRVRVDSAQLPKPLQVNALTNRDWNLSSDWVRPKLILESLGTGP